MDQASSDPTVAIDERMDRLKLCMRDRGLGERRHVVAIDEVDEIAHQRFDMLRWRRDESGAARAVAPAADPVLLGAELAGETLDRPIFAHQHLVHALDVVDGHVVLDRAQLDGLPHGVDVREHLTSRLASVFGSKRGLGQPALAAFEALDAAGRHRLAPQE